MTAILLTTFLENHDFIPNMSISELSLACNTSQSSISRFCRRINNSNFKELKLELMEYNSYLKKKYMENLLKNL